MQARTVWLLPRRIMVWCGTMAEGVDWGVPNKARGQGVIDVRYHAPLAQRHRRRIRRKTRSGDA